jgi:hypothetical protein
MGVIRDDQLIDSTDLLADVLAQVRRVLIVSSLLRLAGAVVRCRLVGLSGALPGNGCSTN